MLSKRLWNFTLIVKGSFGNERILSGFKNLEWLQNCLYSSLYFCVGRSMHNRKWSLQVYGYFVPVWRNPVWLQHIYIIWLLRKSKSRQNVFPQYFKKSLFFFLCVKFLKCYQTGNISEWLLLKVSNTFLHVPMGKWSKRWFNV